MLPRLRLVYDLLILSAAVLTIMPSEVGSAEMNRGFVEHRPIVIAKSDPVLSERAKDFLHARDGEVALIWVFFTDKELFDQVAFEAAADEPALGQRTRGVPGGATGRAAAYVRPGARGADTGAALGGAAPAARVCAGRAVQRHRSALGNALSAHAGTAP